MTICFELRGVGKSTYGNAVHYGIPADAAARLCPGLHWGSLQGSSDFLIIWLVHRPFHCPLIVELPLEVVVGLLWCWMTRKGRVRQFSDCESLTSTTCTTWRVFADWSHSVGVTRLRVLTPSRHRGLQLVHRL